MAYTSDLRIKNYIKDVDREIRVELKKINLEDKLSLRIFDESSEDKILWEKGGLSFKDPQLGRVMGSNDAGWAIDNNPIVVVEGTFGTERGQFGDGQLNRMSHSLGVALSGCLGITMVPYEGQSFVKKGNRNDIISKKVNYQKAFLHKGMTTAALNFSKNNKGKFLIIDPYDNNTLRDLVYHATLKYLNKKNSLDDIINSVLKNMEEYLGDFVYGSRSDQIIKRLYDKNGNIIPGNARIFTQNLSALITSRKRDGHGLLGKNLVELNLSPHKLHSIFIRLSKKDLEILKKRNSKEFSYLEENPRIEIRCLDDLIIQDKNLSKAIYNIKDSNLHQKSEKELIKKIQKSFNVGKIKISL